MQQHFILQNWAVWPPLLPNPEQDALREKALLATVPKMLKRRLSPLAKTVFCAANQCIDEAWMAPTVFSSSHGELAKSFAMLETLQAGEEISPTAFSLSVHNAIAGLFSMAWRNKLQSTVVAPGEEGMAPGFIEALGLLQEGAEQVLLVFYDEPLVDFYPSAPFKVSMDQSCALALRIAGQGEGQRMTMYSSPASGNDGEQALQLPAFIRFLADSQTELIVKTSRHSWCWEKDGQTD
ncbi:beta-ketoacyl synthase chain length factor [Methylomarinum sp. Ch1-1]|uniref:Beta-ketoacyl synthase chain length factor n=1 Tax=Methylomarinum roseum TaxID=3067653 RepID=A0AAU7NX25_9GAMM|nr:beta-ketoacyl synthase chain length factor [Methylomarinum sp. Ch1-1]MDP4522387.1 beta-ketoacyl synthase chain length factor [Methylomarinum sp. Ch1-1]